MKNYKIYTDVKKIGDDYYEAKFKEYNETRLVRTGTEDFSSKRLREQTKKYYVYKHNGRIMKGTREGYKMTDCIGTVRMSINAVAIHVAKLVYGDDVVRVNR